MEKMLESFIGYTSIKTTYKYQKSGILLNAEEFYQRRKEVLIAFEENLLQLPKPYVFGKHEWKERGLGNEKLMPKTPRKSFLENFDRTPRSEKENEFLNRDVGYNNIDELMVASDNIKTDEERDELFDKINNKLGALKKLVK